MIPTHHHLGSAPLKPSRRVFFQRCTARNEPHHGAQGRRILGESTSGSSKNPQVSWAVIKESRAPGWLFYIGDEILPSYMGIIIGHCKDPYKPTSIMECHNGFEGCSVVPPWDDPGWWLCGYTSLGPVHPLESLGVYLRVGMNGAGAIRHLMMTHCNKWGRNHLLILIIDPNFQLNILVAVFSRQPSNLWRSFGTVCFHSSLWFLALLYLGPDEQKQGCASVPRVLAPGQSLLHGSIWACSVPCWRWAWHRHPKRLPSCTWMPATN